MSDDDYYGEYDDFEDGLWDTDPAPDLADDLAEHTAYSPVWQDDPVGELDPYHSDWEYYSDDYYDDDPGLKQNTLDGSVSTTLTMATMRASKRGKKRKLDEVREATTVEKGSLMDCIRGTVWAQEEQDRHVAFRLGQQQSVALLKNWRELFKSKTGVLHTFGKGQLQLDESWANDMSLADMGLLNETEKSGVQEKASIDDEQESGSVDIDRDVESYDDMDTAAQLEPLIGILKTGLKGSDQADPLGTKHNLDLDPEQEADNLSNPSKRRRLAGLPSPPGPGQTKSTGAAVSEVLAKVTDTATITEKSMQHAYIMSENAPAVIARGLPAASTKENYGPISRGRKRKVSPEANESIPADIGHESGTKRIAADRLAYEGPLLREASHSASRLPKSKGK